MKLHWDRASLAALGIALCSTTAMAQTAPDTAAQAQADDRAGMDDGEIVVTARRREEALIDVPLAVTVASGEQIKEANVISLADVNLISPAIRANAAVSRQGVLSFQIRGMQEISGSITADPAVGVYFADAIQTRAQGTGSALYDIQSIQVLKGAQGTLFGRNLTGGAVLIAPMAPQLGRVEGYVQATLGSYDRHELQGAINIPLGQIAALRVGGNITRRDGYFRNLVTGTRLRADHSNSFRASLLIEPSDSFTNTLIVDGYEADTQGGTFLLHAVNPAVNVPVANPYAGRLAQLIAQQNRSPYQVTDNEDNPSTGSNYGITNTTTLSLGAIDLKNIFNWRRVTGFNRNGDVLRESVFALQDYSRTRQITEEFQLSGTMLDDRLNYIAGVYYFNEQGYQQTRAFVLSPVSRTATSRAENESTSIFAQFDFALTPQLTATAGGRYTWDKRSLLQNVVLPTGVVAVNDAFVSKKFSEPTYTLSLSYKPTPDINIYVTTRRGYRSGGFNAGAITMTGLMPVEPEILTDYEAGLKFQGNSGNVRYRASLAAFHSKYDDLQRQIAQLLGTPPTPTRVLTNAGKARVNGVEFESMLSPAPWLELSGGFAYTDAKYIEFRDPITGADLTALPFAHNPKWTYRVGATVTAPLNETLGEMKANISYSYVGDRLISDGTEINPGYLQPSYGLLNARIGLSDIGGKGISLAVFGTNLTKEIYANSVQPFYGAPFGFTALSIGDPRTFGVELGFRF